MGARRTAPERDALPGMVAAWSAFWSCDARDMCRAGPAMARLVLTWMAVALRIATVILFPFVDVYDTAWFYGVVYWGSRANDAPYVEFISLRDEAYRVRDGWVRGTVVDSVAREEALRLSAALRQWRERYRNGYDVWMEDYDLDPYPCAPFRTSGDFFQLLEAQEHDERNDWFSCNYLLLLQ